MSTPYTNSSAFKKAVSREFSKKNGWVVLKLTNKDCVVERDDNPGDCLACLCPGLVQQFQFRLVLQAGGRVNVVDLLEHSFNRMQGHMATGNGNPIASNSVHKMTQIVYQKASRIELALAAAASEEKAKSQKTKYISNDKPNVVKELERLTSFLKDGLLTETEFEAAKQKLLSDSTNINAHAQ